MIRKKAYTFVHFTSYLTILHGIGYWWVKEFMQIESPYGMRPHFLQTYFQAVHIVLSPLLIFSFGMLWNQHIVVFLKVSNRKFFSGLTITISLILVILSGYLIQVLYQQCLKRIAIWVHLIFSALYTLGYVIHHLKKPTNRTA